MADKSISELIAATQVQPTDLFVLEQNSTAKKLTGQTLENWLVALADGHGGIQSVAKTSTSGLVDTYTITYADTTTSTFTVTNGAQGPQGVRTYVWIKYSSAQPTRDQDIYDTPDNWMGVYVGTAATAPTTYTSYSWFRIKGEKGDTGAASAITSQSVMYQESSSGTSVPTGTWTATVPPVAQGNYLWTRIVLTFNNSTTVTAYSVGKIGIDGSGAVSKVCNIDPDGSGNVALTASNIPTSDSSNVQAKITALDTDISGKQPQINTSGILKGNGSGVISSAVAGTDYQAPHKTRTATLTGGAVAWSGNTQTISVSGVTADNAVVVAPAPTGFSAYAEAQIRCTAQGSGTLTFTCEDVPTANISVNILIFD